jgi:hypothetical protein
MNASFKKAVLMNDVDFSSVDRSGGKRVFWNENQQICLTKPSEKRIGFMGQA